MAQFTESLSGAEIDTKDTKRITTDEADETLSLSDLPLYSDRCDELWEDFSGGSHSSSSISSSEDDYFEFYSPESRIPIASYPPENIMFFGKLIPYRKPIDSEEGSPSVEEDVKQKKTSIKKNIYRWFFTSNSNSVLSDNEGDQVANKTLSSKRLEKWYYLSQVHKASMLSSSASSLMFM